MAEPVRLVDWSKGIDNRSPDNRLQEGFARDIVNLDPGATMSSRVGYERVVETEDCRAIMSLGKQILFVDGDQLKVLENGAVRTLATVAGAGPVAHCVHNEELFISTANAMLRYDGRTLRDWGVPDVRYHPTIDVTNTTDNGRRLFAMTYVNQYGEEGGCTPPGSAPDGEYTFDIGYIPPGCRARIYVSPVNAKTLYLQREIHSPGTYTVTRPVDDSAPLETVNHWCPRPGSLMASSGGVILMADDKAVFFTDPMSPHLVRYDRAFFQYPARVNMLLSGLHGVYVSADKCYKLMGVGGNEPRQDTVLDYPAVDGTGTTTTTGQAVWVTRYGMANESTDPREGVSETSNAFYLGEHEHGASSVVEHNGRRRLVATAKRTGDQTGLAAADFFEAEVIRP